MVSCTHSSPSAQEQHVNDSSMYQYIPAHTSTYQYIPVHACIYWHILVHTSTYWNEVIRTGSGMYWYIPVMSATFFACGACLAFNHKLNIIPSVVTTYFRVVYECKPASVPKELILPIKKIVSFHFKTPGRGCVLTPCVPPTGVDSPARFPA